MDLRTDPASRPVRSTQIAGAAGDLAQHRLEQILEIPSLGRRARPLGTPGRRGRLDGDEALLDPLEAGGDLLAELVHRRIEAGRVKQTRELGGVAVEVPLQHPSDAADRAVALRLVEQLVHHGAQRPAVAEELLERSRQAPVTVREVRAERLLQRLRCAFVDLLRLTHHAFELHADGVHVDGHAGVLEGDQADAQGPLHESTAIRRRAFAEKGRERRIGEGESLDHDPVALEPNGLMERDDGSFHARKARTHP